MAENMSQKEMLLRLMDKMDSVEKEQAEHHTYSRSKLESIEAQAIKTNGRVTKTEKDVTLLNNDVKQVKTIWATLTFIGTAVWAVFTFIVK
jgi:hypothetical protein